MLKRLKVLGVAAVATIMMAAQATAAPVIDFSTGLAGTGGSITWDGTNLIGSNILIGAATIDDTAAADGVYVVSGNNVGNRGQLFGSLDFDTTPGNNFISITGCIADLGLGTDMNGNCTAPLTLLSGNISGYNNTLAAEGLVSAFGLDTKHPDLLRAIGLDPNTPFDFFGFSLATDSGLNPDGTPNSLISTDIRNTAVPEPATMMLLGTGLLAAFRARRKQQQQQL